MTATLHPVRMPGSSPSTVLGPAGAASSKSFRLAANTRMASASALSRRRPNNSLSNAVSSLTRHVQRHTSPSQRARGVASRANRPLPSLRNEAMRTTQGWGVSASRSASRPTRNSSTPCWRPRISARMRCEGSVRSGSLKSNQSRKFAPSVSLPSTIFE
ncbi:Uncharacterised protein [Bordetella pertussis]|nr:Uncharacterised protein [Bordetella pertussis]CFW09230.1 Uncharacterised protein [Bordetella pertussis]